MQIHLNDCSSLWEECIQEASESIVVFTPYFDWMLVNLFSDCDLPYSEIHLVTQLDRIDARSENLTRLNRIVELINLGVNVWVVDRLHAKVLIVDDEHAFFGSQNFTNYSMESIEITTQIDRSDDCDEVFEYFSELLLDARAVTLDELNEAAGSIRFSSVDVENVDYNDEDDEDEDENENE